MVEHVWDGLDAYASVLGISKDRRTPPDTLKFWQQHFGLGELSEAVMAPWFQQAEARLSIGSLCFWSAGR